MPRAAAAVTTRSQAASKIRVGPSFCQNAISNSRPGARPRTSRLMITRSPIVSIMGHAGPVLASRRRSIADSTTGPSRRNHCRLPAQAHREIPPARIRRNLRSWCPIPFPKRPNALMASLAWISSNGTTSLTSSSTSWYNRLTPRSPSLARRTMPASRSDIDERTRSADVSSASSSRPRDGSPSEIAIRADVSITINPELRNRHIRESLPGCGYR